MLKLEEILSRQKNYIFLILLMGLYLVLDFQHILFLRPCGIHFIRQTDSLSFVANYFKNGFHFWNPQVFNLQSINGNAACEFPILYFITAGFYSVFNEHEFILRLLTLALASTGFFFLFRLLHLMVQDVVYAIVFSFLFISSTVLLYYSNNYLPDASAFGLTLTGWYFFFAFTKNKSKPLSLILSFIFFTLSSLIKVTHFINPATGIIALFVFDFQKTKNIYTTLKKNTISSFLFVAAFLIVVCWNRYAMHYNEINHENYFLMHYRPIWNMQKNEIAEVWGFITGYWYTSYYYQSTWHALLVMTLLGLVYIKKSDNSVLIPASVLFLGSACFLLLFYAQFRDHDYYFITLMPSIIFIVTNGFVAVKNKFPRIVNGFFLKIMALVLCILSLNYAKGKMVRRFERNDDQFASVGYCLSSTRHYLDSIGVPQNAKFIIVSDPTPNGGLYFINRAGWSIKDTSDIGKTNLENYINAGADYILFPEGKDVMQKFNNRNLINCNGPLIYKITRNL